MRRLPAVGLAVGLATVCTACYDFDGPASPQDPAPAGAPGRTGAARLPVTGGEPAPDDAAAVALSLRGLACGGAPGAVVCSGALVSGRVVLTAGHCAEPYARGRIEVWTGAALGDPNLTRRAVSDIRVHPHYTEASSDFDAAVLLLASPLPAVPWPVLATPMDASWVGRSVRVLGFGEPQAGAGTGERRAGDAVITEVAGHTFTMAPDPALTCHGDSGGPVLADIDGTPHLVGITSAGDARCADWAVAVRVDALIPGFLDSALAVAPEEQPPILPSETCEAPCTGDADCPADLVCAEDGSGDPRCVLPGLSPGSFPAGCDEDTPCGEGQCVALGPECRCHVTCEPAPASGEEAGCSLAPGRGSPSPAERGWLAVWGLSLLASLRCRWRTLRIRSRSPGSS